MRIQALSGWTRSRLSTISAPCVVAGTVAVAIVVLTAFGTEAKGVAFGNSDTGRRVTASPAL